MDKRNFAKAVSAPRVIGLVVMSLISASANAQEVTPVAIDQSEALAMDARIYAETYGVTFDDALKRLIVMTEADGDIESAESEDGVDFAGAYFDNGATNFGLVIRTKKPSKLDRTLVRRADKSKYAKALDKNERMKRREDRKNVRTTLKLADDQVEKAEEALATDQNFTLKYKPAALHSVAELASNAAGSALALKAIPGFQTYYVDERSGEIVILVNAPSVDEGQAAAAKALKVPFRVERRPGGFMPVAFRGGQFTKTPSFPQYCMVSFGAKHNTAKTAAGVAQTGVVTANHCDTTETISLKDPADGVIYPLVKGVFVDTRGGASTADIRFLYHATRLGSSQFYFDNSGTVRTVTAAKTRSGTTARTGATNGSFVCHLGQSSLGSSTYAQSCGEVISTVAAQNFGTGGNLSFATTGGAFVMVRNTQSGAGTTQTSGTGTLKCYQGDSGGPWFAGTVAYGVMSACSWKDVLNGTASESLYTSTDYFTTMGVTILVN